MQISSKTYLVPVWVCVWCWKKAHDPFMWCSEFKYRILPDATASLLFYYIAFSQTLLFRQFLDKSLSCMTLSQVDQQFSTETLHIMASTPHGTVALQKSGCFHPVKTDTGTPDCDVRMCMFGLLLRYLACGWLCLHAPANTFVCNVGKES